MHTNFYHTNIQQLEIIEISLTKITKQNSMKDGFDTKCKIKFRVVHKINIPSAIIVFKCLERKKIRYMIVYI